MKPNLVNKNLIYDYIEKKKEIIHNIKIEKNNIFFNFLIILFIIICILILVYRYLEKRKNKENIS
jgi:ABC-type lipoprotein release transport system permease subunit